MRCDEYLIYSQSGFKLIPSGRLECQALATERDKQP